MSTILILLLICKMIEVGFIVYTPNWNGLDLLLGLASIAVAAGLSWMVYLGREWIPFIYAGIQVAYGIKHLLDLAVLFSFSNIAASTQQTAGLSQSSLLFLVFIRCMEIVGGLVLFFSPSVQTYFAYARSEFGSELVE